MFRATIKAPLDMTNFRSPDVGDLVSVECQPKNEKAKFDTSGAKQRADAARQLDEERFDAMRNASPGTSAQPDAELGGGSARAARKQEILERAKAESQQASDHGGPGPDGASASALDPLERLQKLADLRDRGALTDEEFAAKKAEILKEA